MVRLKRQLNILINGKSDKFIGRRIFDASISILIILNIAAIVFESFQWVKDTYGAQLEAFELFSVIVFTTEYLLRLWCSDVTYKAKTPLKSAIKYITSPMAIVDLLAIMPFYLPFFMAIDLRHIRALRLFRLLRILKLNRHSKSLNLVTSVLRDKKEELGITILVTIILLIIASALMFELESEIQPEAFPDILHSFWWAISTLATIGYGDVYPHSGAGKFLSGIIALLGLGLIALPTGILSSAFMEKFNENNAKKLKKKEKKHMKYCPHCGEKLDDGIHPPPLD